jgi:hypothetical protein
VGVLLFDKFIATPGARNANEEGGKRSKVFKLKL